MHITEKNNMKNFKKDLTRDVNFFLEMKLIKHLVSIWQIKVVNFEHYAIT